MISMALNEQIIIIVVEYYKWVYCGRKDDLYNQGCMNNIQPGRNHAELFKFEQPCILNALEENDTCLKGKLIKIYLCNLEIC